MAVFRLNAVEHHENRATLRENNICFEHNKLQLTKHISQ